MSDPNPRRKGIILLSTGRSGTNWLKSISDATGRMGNMGEWLGFEKLEKPWKAYTAQSYYDYIMQHTSTANGRFSMKIFPRHLRLSQASYGFDFIAKCAREHDVKFYLITRDDRLGQAISLLKAQQNAAWHSEAKASPTQTSRPLRYNFRRLCRLYFDFGQAYDFWRSYLSINGFEHEHYSYEQLLPDPSPFFESLAQHLEVAPPDNYESRLKIQRDALTQEWRERFQADIAREGIHPDTYSLHQPDRSLKNALRVWRGEPIKPANGGF